jgi:hypothetical protein
MIAALLPSNTPVEITDAAAGIASAMSIGRENIGQSYIGGIGYTGVRAVSLDAAELIAVAQLDQDCEPLRNWLDAMSDTDRLADEHSPATAAALEIEADARQAFADYIKANALKLRCPRHGELTFDSTEGGMHFNGEPYDDLRDVTRCAFCGEVMEGNHASSVLTPEMEIPNTPEIPVIAPLVPPASLFMEGSDAENVPSFTLAAHRA